jgi:hypothetical protein
MFSGIPVAQNTIYIQFEKNGSVAGGVSVFLYENQSDLERAYQLVIDGFGDTKVTVEVGDEAVVASFSSSVGGVNLDVADLAFVRCSALVHIRMSKGADKDSITAYAKRLDNRLIPIVCR